MIFTVEEDVNPAMNNDPDFFEKKNAETVILTTQKADELKEIMSTPPRRKRRGSDYAPRRSATPKGTQRGTINLVNVDKYVGKISKL